MHVRSESSILYFGTPVLLVSTVNDDGSANLAPISSAFWLGWRCVIGIGASSQTARNLRREGSAVLNLASVSEVAAVNRLALTTGANPVPARKSGRGYRHVKDKFAWAGLTPQASETVTALRVAECLVQQEAVVTAVHGIADDDELQRGGLLTCELRVQRLHLHSSILLDGNPDRVDPDRWRPLLMSFQQFYGLHGDRLQVSALAQIPEQAYRSPDVDKARQVAALICSADATC